MSAIDWLFWWTGALLWGWCVGAVTLVACAASVAIVIENLKK